jgi:hypothetical protein
MLAGAGSAAAVAALSGATAALSGATAATALTGARTGAGVSGAAGQATAGPLTFRAIAALPQAPHNAWAAQVVDGTVDLVKGLGVITSRVMAAGVELPGFTRHLRVTAASRSGQIVRLSTQAAGRSQLRQAEDARAVIVVDTSRGLVQAPFLGRLIEHRLS